MSRVGESTDTAYYTAGPPALHPRQPPSAWTHYYWPAALAVSVLGFLGALVLHVGNPAWALWVGVGLLGIPETAMAIIGRWNNTFSVWVWDTLRVTQGRPISEWRASQFLALGAYLVVCATVCSWVAQHEAIGWTVASCWVSLWLAFHFFNHQWT